MEYVELVERIEYALAPMSVHLSTDSRRQTQDEVLRDCLTVLREQENALRICRDNPRAQDEDEIARLQAIVDSPDARRFLKASELEAKHQQMRWTGDGGKADADWFWLIGYLGGKALHNPGGDTEKKLHRITTIAAAAANWHAAVLGNDSMQPEMPTRYAAEEAVRAKMVEYDLDERYAESLSDAVLALFAPKETT